MLAGGAIVYCAFYHGWQSMTDWLGETAAFAAALAIAAAGMGEASRRLASGPAPEHQALRPDRTATALLVEVLVLA